MIIITLMNCRLGLLMLDKMDVVSAIEYLEGVEKSRHALYKDYEEKHGARRKTFDRRKFYQGSCHVQRWK